jgi:hypothetical protein
MERRELNDRFIELVIVKLPRDVINIEIREGEEFRRLIEEDCMLSEDYLALFVYYVP